ncbi:MAG: recombination protein O N-terminal domain-containing protein [Candidatus Paceibacterota bacterium]|jgi:recombinational DNA repair protein (RecF pathway)
MKELVSEAIVLGREPSRGSDRTVALLTKEVGYIHARAVGGLKILSKFAPHLDPGSLVEVRLAKKNGYTLTDVLTKDRFDVIRGDTQQLGKALRVLFFIQYFFPENVSDARLWGSLLGAFESGKIQISDFLIHAGYDIRHATCTMCGARKVDFITIDTHEFICLLCSTKLPENRIVLIHN